MLILTEEHKNFIKADSKDKYPNECCGIFLGNNIISCKNNSLDPFNSFLIDSEQLYQYNINDITAFYHSHKDIRDFSKADIAFSEKLKMKSILYVCDIDIFSEYIPLGVPIPYIDRPFLIGEFDCFTLCKEYLNRELNINLSNIDGFTNHPAIKNYKKWSAEEFKEYENNTLIKDFFLMQGFSEIDIKDIKKHDIILTRMPGVKFTSHICIYLGENKILHHFYDFSGITPYNNALKRLTTHVLRHESLL